MFREDVIARVTQGKKVLDCGGVDHDAFDTKQAEGIWLHDLICKKAIECIGVDILASNVERINQSGKYKFIVANAEELPFKSEFDVIVAGEIVEHLHNMGKFLESAWTALREDGQLVITTPNNSSLTSMIYSTFLRRELCHPEHTCYYSPQTLKYIVKQHGFEVDELHVLPRTSQSAMIRMSRQWIGKFNALLADQIVLVARKAGARSSITQKW